MKKSGIIILLLAVFVLFGQQLRFALITDTHSNGTLTAEAVEQVNRDKFDVAIVSGDLTNRGEDAELLAIKEQLDKINIPYYAIPGNHETNWSQSAGQTFVKLWGADRFEFERNGYLFLGFSTGPDMKMGDGHVRAEDLIWLRETLKAKFKPGLKVVIIAHYPLHDEHLGNWHQVIEILKPYPVVAVFGGHFHSNRHFNYEGIHGIVCRSLVMGKHNPGFCAVDLDGTKVTVTEISKNEQGEFIQKILWNFDSAAPESLKGLRVSVRPKELGGELPQGWKVEKMLTADASVFTGAAFAENTVYYGTSTGELRAYDYVRKQQLWSVKTGGPVFSTPLVSGELVICGSTANYLAAYDRGREVWRIKAHVPLVNDGLLADGFLYMGLGSGEFCKIDPKDGRKIWSFDGVKDIFQAPPAVGGGKVVFGAWDRHLYCLNITDGTLAWKWNNNHGQKLYSPGNCQPVIADNKVFIVAPDRYMTALDLASGKQLWRSNKHKFRESLGGSVYAKSMDGTLIAVAPAAAEYTERGVVDLGFGYEHNPCPNFEYGGVVYSGSRSGTVSAVDAKTLTLLWTYKCGNSSVNRFAAAPDGSVWATLIDGGIWRISK